MAVDDGPHADPGIGVDLQGRRAVQCAVHRMIREVRHPGIEKVGQEFEERPTRIELTDAVLHIGTHALAADVCDERVEVEFVGEILEQASLGDSGAPGDDVQAASREPVCAELGLRGLDHCRATRRVDACPCHRWHRVLPGSMTTGHITVRHVTVKGVPDLSMREFAPSSSAGQHPCRYCRACSCA